MKDNTAVRSASPGRRAASYWFIDGLPHGLFGLALLLSGASGLLWGLYVPDLRVRHYLILGTGMLLYLLLGRRLLDLLKARITYPRTGYVQPPEKAERFSSDTLTTLDLQPGSTRKENVTSFERRTVIVIFFFLSSPWEGSPRWFVPALIAALAATLYVLNRTSERPYSWGWALVLALLGLVPLLPYLLVGLWLAAQGAWTLVRYLRTNPYPTTAEGVRA